MKSAWPALLFGGLAIAFAVWFGPTLAADFAARGQVMRTAGDAEIQKASCRSILFLLTTCSVVVVERAGAHELRYAVTGLVRRERLAALRSETDPGYLTTSLGRDTLPNRGATFAGWLAVLLALTWGGVRYHARHGRGAV